MQEETKNKAAPVTPARGHCPACGKSFFWSGPCSAIYNIIRDGQPWRHSWRQEFANQEIRCPRCGVLLRAKDNPRWLTKAKGLNTASALLIMPFMIYILLWGLLFEQRSFWGTLTWCFLGLAILVTVIARFRLERRQQFELCDSEESDSASEREKGIIP